MSLEHTDVQKRIQDQFGDSILSYEMQYDIPVLEIDHARIFELMQWLKQDAELNFSFLTTCCGLHYPDQKKPFGMMYQLHNLQANYRLRIKAFNDKNEPVFPSLIPLYKTANWMERETYDFFGFHFEGHPNLTRILNMDSLEGWPLRKEYPLEDQTRMDKDDKMFGR
ncbi:MAG TPA: NADH-quinone oxidoreductase subunit C [Bacteroidia bacterium]|nr:NADH-quinone oxidoreductase subunit C [Bacteroidia bacterium]HNT81011.1 NADH-quinone oxidoreductase subunit C [Bacteroidia bacterium]